MRRTSYTMDGFCLLYLLLLLLMRSGDVETNPGPHTAESTVSEKEFLKLAKAIDPSHYQAVGISLEIPLAELHAILIQQLNNYTNAFLHVFMKWNVKQQPLHSNRRQLLADALREIDLGGLSDRLLNEPLTPNSTGVPSRLLESQTKPPSAESQTKPLSPELVERCANDFKFKYRSTLCKIRSDPLNPASTVQFKDLYTNLVLLEEYGTEKRVLDYNNMLDLKVNGEFPKRIMVQGEAGAGKTTFCAKIAWDWVEGRHFSHFVWVLIVPLREFKQHSIGEIAKSYLPQNNPATVSQITEYIRSNPDKVFIAFDGLDEVSFKIMPTDQMQLQPSQPCVTSSEACGSSSETGDIGLVEILCSDQLASCPVLVTTRPWRAVEIRSDGDLMKLYTFIRVEGFNRENLSVYIYKYFPKNDDKANQLIQFTSENDVISENMAHYPIYVAMLCLMWKELDEQKLKVMKSLKSFSQIFKEMIAFLKEHYAQKKVKKVGSPSFLSYLKKIDELLGPIAKQALNGLLENTLIFGEDDFQICPESKETACKVGILSQEDRITTSIDIHKRDAHVQLPVFFPHKLFQEYMAGVHLASLYESDRNAFNMLIEQVVLPRKNEFRYLLYFTVSQNKSIATYILNSMLQGLDIDVHVGRELPIIVGYYADVSRLDIAVGRELSFIVDVAFESQDPDVAVLVKDRVSSKEIALTISDGMTAHTVAGYAFIGPHVVSLRIDRSCGPTMSLDVAEIICSMPSLKKVCLQYEFCGHQCFFETLARKGKESKVQTVRLDALLSPTPASSHHLAEALCYMPNLTDLTLGNVLREEFSSTLKSKTSSIQGCFPQIRKGNFRLNGVAQDDLNSFVHTLACLQSPYFRYDSTYHATMSSSTPSPNPPVSRHDQPVMSAGSLSPTQYLPPVPESTGATRTIMPWSSQNHYTQSYHASTSSSALLCNPPVSGYHQPAVSGWPISDAPFQPKVLELSGSSQPRPSQNSSTTGFHPASHYPPIVWEKTSRPGSSCQVSHSTNFSCPIQSTSSTGRDHPQQQPMADVHYPRRALPPSDNPQQQHMGDVHYPRTLPQSYHPQQQPMADVHYLRRALPPSDHPQQQPMGNVHYPRRTLPPSDHPQQQPLGDVLYQRTLPSSDHPQQQPMGDVHYPRRTLPPSDHPQQQPMGDVHYPRMTLLQSDHPQQQPLGDVNYPRRTLPSSDHPQQHVGNTLDTVFQFSQTHREGSSSLSRPYKRQATCTQSRVPQDDPEIQEKRSKYEVRQCPTGNTSS